MEEAASTIIEEVPHTKTPIILHYLIEANKTAKTLISISELSLYSWVFKITDPTTGNIYVIKTKNKIKNAGWITREIIKGTIIIYNKNIFY
jgi:hypothetical protein